MRVLNVRNVHQALPLGLRLLSQEGVERDSRNGRVRVAPYPVTTVYERPCERVLFWWKRDANPFFHLYESLWMLAGRNDVGGVAKYAKNMASFSDDRRTFHGAYGYRWRQHFGTNQRYESGIGEYEEWKPLDQLSVIARALKRNPEDRRCVLEMWDAPRDLGRTGKDFPCNLTATFQRDPEGKLDLAVFCRSNDIIWGAYGANAVHFSFLLEYMALWIGCPVGVYRQVSVNWHGYLATLLDDTFWNEAIDRMGYIEDPYSTGLVHSTPMGPDFETVDREIARLLAAADSGLMSVSRETRPSQSVFPWAYNVHLVLEAHEIFRKRELGVNRFRLAQETLAEGDQSDDWIRAAKEWLTRREHWMTA